MDKIKSYKENNRPGILAGVRVLDLTRVLAGPYASMMLADLGAEVVKIEVPGRGDDSRYFMPFKKGKSMYFGQINRNKKSIVLNLKSDEGKELFKKMIPHFDVVLENFRPGVMDKLGLGYSVLEELNPAIVYGALSGYGQYGPYAQRPGYDITAQALSGMMEVTGWPDGEPTRCGPPLGDIFGGLDLAIGVLAALVRAQRTGHGDMVDVSLLDSAFSAMGDLPQQYFTEGKNPTRLGNFYLTNYPYDSFKAKDGIYVIGIANNKLFGEFCEVIGRPDLPKEERFANNTIRAQNHVELKQIIEDWSAQMTVAEVVELFVKHGLPVAEVYKMDQIVRDPHIADAREMIVTVDDPDLGTVRVSGTPFKYTHGYAGVQHAAPNMGQDTAAILKELLEVSEEDLTGLKERGVIE